MDKLLIQSPNLQDPVNQSAQERNESSFESVSANFQSRDAKYSKNPGRPPFRVKDKSHHQNKNMGVESQNNEDLDTQKPKTKEKNHPPKEQRENNIDGFIKIIDYLKKIQCDQASLHNKMNPFNLLTPTCFWYMIGAEYFSFDFFNNRNVHQEAHQLFRKAQKTQILLPLRMSKIQKIPEELDFQTVQLRQFAMPITQKLINLIPQSSNSPPEILERSTFVTQVSEDNQFRSSIRSICFNWIKKKMIASDKWRQAIQPKLEMASKLPTKDFTSKILQCKEQVKYEELDGGPEMHCRQRKGKKSSAQIRVSTKPMQAKKVKKNSKKKCDDQIYEDSEEDGVLNNEEMIDQKKQEIEENEEDLEMQIQQQKKQQVENIKLSDESVLVKSQSPIKQSHQQHPNSDDEQNNQRLREIQSIITTKNYTQDDLLLDSILHLPIDSIISILKSSIQPVKLPELIRPYLPIPKSDPLELVYQTHPEQDIFLNYMRDRQQKHFDEKVVDSEQLIEEKQREGQAQDAKCQVCTDGDYTDDNLIVFCSMCNISLHQRCVGLAKVPADNWICQVCTSFGPAGINVPCPICHVRGGAMKRTSIHINTHIFKDTNPQYHEYAKKCPNYKNKEEYPHPIKEDEPYYDYFSKVTYPNDQPVCHFVWVHYVCAIWVPECYFEEKNGAINVKGVDNIDKKRFKQKCVVCKLSKAGACVKCQNENCCKFYHPQCARRRRVYMQQLNLDKLKYLIFCEAHEPLKIKRIIQVKKKKQRDEIVKFCRGIEKYVETYKIAYLPFKLLKVGASPNNETNKNRVAQGELKVHVKIDKYTDEDFIRFVIDGLIKQNQIVVNLRVLGSKKFKVDEVIKPSKRDMRKSLTRQDQFWKTFKSSDTCQANFKRFNEIMRQNSCLREKIDNFINNGVSLEGQETNDHKRGRSNGRKKRQKIETVIEEQGGIFCVCRKPYEGQNDMFECQVCNEWYHHKCIGFIGTEQDAQKLDFHCMKCLKYESLEEKKGLLEKCSKYFSFDSLFLNYRPPTPSLQSEEEQNKEVQCPSNNQYKQSVVSVQKSQLQIPNKPPIPIPSKNIPAHTINYLKPFIVFDPKRPSEEIEHFETKLDKQFEANYFCIHQIMEGSQKEQRQWQNSKSVFESSSNKNLMEPQNQVVYDAMKEQIQKQEDWEERDKGMESAKQNNAMVIDDGKSKPQRENRKRFLMEAEQQKWLQPKQEEHLQRQ